MARRAFVVWGSSGHGRVLRDMLEPDDRVVALVDNNADAQPIIEGVPLLIGAQACREFIDAWSGDPLNATVAIGGARGADRRAILAMFADAGVQTPAMTHPRAFVAPSAIVGAGSHVMAQATLAADAVLGRGVILNHGVVVDHECILDDGVHIAPGATLCGCVRVDADAFVGAGATVLPRLHIGAGSVVGAGATVTADVPAGATVVGAPARPLT
ncbi:MAG: sugar acetyltransferase [Pseudooceanicola sp.]|nr:sugar acetyltransferase [Pseudooceanicola sp.]